MTHLLGPNKVKYQDDAGIFQPLSDLLFCRYGKTLRSQNSCNTQIEGYFCPQNLSGIPKNDCFARQGKSNTSYLCPICNSVLKLRGIAEKPSENSANSENPENPGSVSHIPKPYYLICHNCRWSTKDVNLENHDQIGNEWETPINPDLDYFNQTKKFLLEDYTNYLKESDERDLKIKQHQDNVQRKRASAPKLGKMSNNPLANIMAEKYGSKWSGGDALAKLKDKAGGKIFGLSKEKFLKVGVVPQLGGENCENSKSGENTENSENPVTKTPSFIKRFNPEADSITVEAMKKSDSMEPYTNLTQRLKSPSVQPILTKNLRPLSGPVVMQASLKYDGHRLIKPDFNPANTKPKIASLAVDTVPTIEIEDFNLDNFNKTREIDIFVTNPNYRATKFYLLPYNGKLEMENGERMRNELDCGQIFNCSCPGEEITLQGSVQGVAVDSEVVRVSEDVVCFGNKCKIRVRVSDFDDGDVDLKCFYVGMKVKFDYREV